MDLKKLFLATLVGGTGMWVIAGVWHNLIMPSLYEGVHASHDGIGLLLVSYYILSLFMSYLYTAIHENENNIMKGVKVGVIVGVLWVFPHGLAMAGAHGDSLLYVFKNSAWHIFEQGVGGGVIGFVYCKTSNRLKTSEY